MSGSTWRQLKKRLAGADTFGTYHIELQCRNRLLVGKRGINIKSATVRSSCKRHFVRAIEVAADTNAFHPVVGIVGVEVHGSGKLAELRFLHRYGDVSLLEWSDHEGHPGEALCDIVKEHDLFYCQRHIAAVVDTVVEFVLPA